MVLVLDVLKGTIPVWGAYFLKVEPLLLIWIVTFVGLGLYLFGKIKFQYNRKQKSAQLATIKSNDGFRCGGYRILLSIYFWSKKHGFTNTKK